MAIDPDVADELKPRDEKIQALSKFVEAMGPFLKAQEEANKKVEEALKSMELRLKKLEGSKPPIDPPPPPQPKPERPTRDRSGAVEINPGQSLFERQSILDKHKKIIVAGTLKAVSIIPKDDQWFFAKDGDHSAVLDGQGQNIRAFHGGAKRVFIDGIDVTNYSSGLTTHFENNKEIGDFDQRDPRGQIGAIHPSAVDGLGPAEDWIYVGGNVDRNDCRGITVCPGMMVAFASVSHNLGMTGIGGSAAPGQKFGPYLLVEGNNRSGKFNRHHDSGGIKLTGGGRTPAGQPTRPLANDIIFKKVISRKNLGPGMWLDWDIKDVDFDECIFHLNERGGLILECCAYIRIKKCKFGRNLTVGDDNSVMSFKGAGVGIQNTKKALIEDCEFWLDNGFGIYVQYQCRPAAIKTPMGGPNIGWFTGTENIARNNRAKIFGNGKGWTGESLSDEPAKFNNNRSCNSILFAGELADIDGSGSRITPRDGVHPASSARKRYPNSNDYCFIPRMKVDNLYNDFQAPAPLNIEPKWDF